jgi:hypothetical protein
MTGSQALGKRSWFDLPASARTGIERRLGAAVSAFDPAAGGFSDGVLGLGMAAADRVFIKAVPSDSSSAADYRTEAAVSQILPPGVPTPRLRFTFEQHGWLILCFDAVDGRHPAEPWRAGQLEAVLQTLHTCENALSSAALPRLPTVADRMRGRCRTWRSLAETGIHNQLGLDDLSAWERDHLDRLAQVEDGWEREIVGEDLLHFDRRFDNIMLGPGETVWFLDWGRACTGPRWVDVVGLLLESDLGAIDAPATFAAHTRGSSPDNRAVDAFLVALASNWRHSATTPHAPDLRARRIRSRNQTLAWLAHRWP